MGSVKISLPTSFPDMSISMPASFPMDEFRKFGKASATFFPRALTTAEALDKEQRRLQSDWAWQAVRYRYRLCAECTEEFKTLYHLDETSQPGESQYKLERCIYTFFMGSLSVFESFAFCLYFLGGALKRAEFPYIGIPKKITLATTQKAFGASFPFAAITAELANLDKKPEFTTIDGIRNILAHRLSGRPSSNTSCTRQPDGTFTTDFVENTWYIPGIVTSPTFDKEMLQRFLDDITNMLLPLISAAREFAEEFEIKAVKI
jgi:hypothetical protein